jgi:prophage antirepressor-like protein
MLQRIILAILVWVFELCENEKSPRGESERLNPTGQTTTGNFDKAYKEHDICIVNASLGPTTRRTKFTMQYALKVFEYEDHSQFRAFEIGGDPWFVLADVCRALDIKNVSDAATRLDEDEKGVAPTDTPGGKQNVRIINESGLYTLILRSEKPEAKRFKKWVTSQVLPAIRKTGSYHGLGRIPAFIRRYNQNWDRVDLGYFSVINELVTRLWGRFEMLGHILADIAPDGKELRPDNSVGRLFSDWLSAKHPTVCADFSYYQHWTPQWEGPARQYPNTLWPLFVEYVDNVWIPEHAEEYLRVRDPAALPYLPKLLPSPDKPRPGMIKGRTLPKWKKAS